MAISTRESSTKEGVMAAEFTISSLMEDTRGIGSMGGTTATGLRAGREEVGTKDSTGRG